MRCAIGTSCEGLGAGAETRYCYSTDEEEFYGDFDTREDALAEAYDDA